VTRPGDAATSTRIAAAVIGLVLAAMCLPGQAGAARGLTLGFGDPAFRTSARDQALDRAVAANANLVRIAGGWRGIAPSRPSNPSDPADPAYRFTELDAAVRAAAGRGLQILLEIGRAPDWAEGTGRPSTSQAPPGTWRPQPEAYGRFAQAVARRYSGTFSPGLGQPPLPQIRHFQAGNEPNLSTYLTPQWTGGTIEAARVYRALLTAFYEGIKSVSPGATVVTAGTAPYGDEPGGRRSRPVAFLREALCLNGGCTGAVPFDVLAHHPINAFAPTKAADNPEDATTPDIDRIRAVLRAAEKRGHVRPAGPHPIWVTEFWWESNPPDGRYGVTVKKHARYTAEALRLFWKQRVPVALGLQLADDPIDSANPGDTFQTGLYFADGRPKAALRAFRFPLVATRGKRRVEVWGRAPASGQLAIQVRRGRRWRTIDRFEASAASVFRERYRLKGKPSVRAKVAGEASLAYRARKG
jgi:hypothetical protein